MADVYVINSSITPRDIGNGVPARIVPGTRQEGPTVYPGYLVVDDSVITAINALPSTDVRKQNLALCSVLSAADGPAAIATRARP